MDIELGRVGGGEASKPALDLSPSPSRSPRGDAAPMSPSSVHSRMGSPGVSEAHQVSWGFDPATDRVLHEFETVRDKQLQLALDHVNLPPLVVDDVSVDNSEESSAEAFERNAARFLQREEDMSKLMRKLDDLTAAAYGLACAYSVSLTCAL